MLRLKDLNATRVCHALDPDLLSVVAKLVGDLSRWEVDALFLVRICHKGRDANAFSILYWLNQHISMALVYTNHNHSLSKRSEILQPFTADNLEFVFCQISD